MSKIFKAAKKAVSKAFNFVKKVVKAVVDVVASVVNFVVQPFMSLFGAPGAPDANQEAARQDGVLLQQQGSNVNIPVVYGMRKIGGTVVYAETGSTKNKYLWVAYVLGEGPVEGLREIYIDDWQMPAELITSINAGNNTTINADRYKNRTQLQFFPGVYFSDPARSPLGATVKNGIFAGAPSFKDTMDFNGLAVMFARYEWKEIKTQEDADNNPFSGNIPQLQVTMLGRKIANVSTAETYTSYDNTPQRYSTNPAEVLLDYLRNPRYGKGVKNEDIDWDSWKIASSKCNTEVTYLASGTKGPIMTCNFVLDTQQTLLNNTKTLLSGFRAYMPYVQGKYKLKIEDAGNPTDITSGAATIAATFTKDDMIGQISYTGIEKSAKYNVVAINYVDPDQKYSVQQVIYPETESQRQSYIDLDGGRENKLESTFPTITNYAIAKDYARLLFNKSRQQETASITVTSRGIELEPGDCIRISGNILDFDETPWRIVQHSLNEDMSVTLGCVKNPDSIYPYVTVGEEDYVLPTYVPKGSTIYYPAVIPAYPLGLVPPTNALQPTNFVPTPLVPATTVPGTDGGGIGGGGDTANNTPDNPPPANPFTAAVSFSRSIVTDWRNGTYTWHLKFLQPDDGLYSHSILWWRPNSLTPYEEIKLEQQPGGGEEINVNIGPLPQGTYEFFIRSYAADDAASINILKGSFAYTDLLAQDPTFSGFIGAEQTLVNQGWAPPGITQTFEARHDDDIDVLKLEPVFSGSSPRKMRLTIQQIKNTTNKPLNTLITGCKVYYKLSGTDYYDYEIVRFPANYYPGQTVTKTLDAEFGNYVYPANIAKGSFNDTLQKYDFVVRLLYSDGERATKQLGPATGRVEFDFDSASNNFVSVGTSTTNPVVPMSSGVINTIYENETFLTVDQNPNKDYGTGLEIVPNVRFISAFQFENNFYKPQVNISLYMNPPLSSKLRAYRIRYRRVIQGETTEFFYRDSGSTVVTATDFNENGFETLTKQLGIPEGTPYIPVFFQGSDFVPDATYDIVITALVSTATGRTEANDSLVARIKIDADSDYTENLYDKFNFEVLDTNVAIGNLRTTFPVNPVINIKSWNKNIITPEVAPRSFNVEKVDDTNYHLNAYYTARFQMNSTADAIVVYRRMTAPSSYFKTTATEKDGAKYYGLGPWEKIRVDVVDLDVDSDGWYVLNLRGPIHWDYFEITYEVEPTATLVNPKYGASGKFPAGKTSLFWDYAGIYPYYGTGNQPIDKYTQNPLGWSYAQFMFVIEEAGQEGPRALLLNEFQTDVSGPNFLPAVDGFLDPGVPKRELDDYEEVDTGLDSGYGRKLSEAVTGVTVDQLWDINSGLISELLESPPTKASYGEAFNIFLQNPKGGEDVK